MNKAMKYIQNTLLFLAVVVLAAGCIKDDFDDCNNVTIDFIYKADGNTDVLGRYMTKIDLYVFDESGNFCELRSYGEDELKQGAYSFRLAPGRYDVVAVGNPFDKTEVVNHNTARDFDNIFIQHPGFAAQSGSVSGHDDNYLGQKSIEIPSYKINTHETVELFSAHIDVDIEIKGFPAPGQGGEMPFTLSIDQSNARTSFNNKIVGDAKGICHPVITYDAESGIYHSKDLRLFRMDSNGKLEPAYCQHRLVLTETASGKELLRSSLYDYLKEHEDDIDVTRQEAYLPISIVYKGIGLEAEINIPDWAIVGGEPEWK